MYNFLMKLFIYVNFKNIYNKRKNKNHICINTNSFKYQFKLKTNLLNFQNFYKIIHR